MSRILITGGSGFIGTNLLPYLVDGGNTVVNLDRTQPVNKNQTQYWKLANLLDYENLAISIIAFDPEIIVHLAAVTDLNGKNLDYYSANIKGVENIIDIASKVKSLRKVLFTSSMYVCEPGYIPKDDDDYKPHTLYGQSKVAGEILVKNINAANYEWIIIRPTSIWGPWFNIPYIDFFYVVYQGKYFDFGRACTKTYGYVGNSVYQIGQLIVSENLHSHTFYIGDLPPIPISEWANEISLEMGKGEIKKVSFSLLKCAALLGDILKSVGVKFPITSFRLNNMTTDNILPLAALYENVGTPPYTRLEGVKQTITWLKTAKKI